MTDSSDGQVRFASLLLLYVDDINQMKYRFNQSFGGLPVQYLVDQYAFYSPLISCAFMSNLAKVWSILRLGEEAPL